MILCGGNSLSPIYAALLRQEKEKRCSAEHTHKKEGLVPLIPVVIWTCGLGGLLPAPFFAEIYKETNRRKEGRQQNEGRAQKGGKEKNNLIKTCGSLD